MTPNVWLPRAPAKCTSFLFAINMDSRSVFIYVRIAGAGGVVGGGGGGVVGGGGGGVVPGGAVPGGPTVTQP